ncbi:MAG: nucleotidyltransferase family protein [Spirochaetales bacterium]|nr:nucleotidyltransferase family protein [Spirochaetales bacterium]
MASEFLLPFFIDFRYIYSMTLDQIKSVLIQKKPSLLASGISEIGIFGSYIRGEQNENSDVDILIDLVRPSKLDLLQLISIEDDLKEELGVPVDLVIKTSLKPNISKTVLAEVEYL